MHRPSAGGPESMLGLLAGAALLLTCCAPLAKGHLKVDGWTEIKGGWPIESKNYFVATEKGHHFIEVKLPPKVDYDLSVTLNYYYHYARAKPIIQMTPCNDNIFIRSDHDEKGQWIRHTQQVSRANCHARPELAFNVVLHDPGDVFAWSSIEVQAVVPPAPPKPSPKPKPEPKPDQAGQEQKAEPPATESPKTTQTEPSGGSGDEQSSDQRKRESDGEKQLSDMLDQDLSLPTALPDKTTTVAPVVTTATATATTTTSTSTTKTTLTTTTTSAPASANRSYGPTTTGKPAEVVGSKTEPASDKSQTVGDDKVEATAEVQSVSTATTRSTPWDSDSGGLLRKSEGVARAKAGLLDFPRANAAFAQLVPAYELTESNFLNPTNRFKRDGSPSAANEGNDNELPRAPQSVVCEPKHCDRHTFHMARFSALFEGAPKRPADSARAKYFLNLKNQPLKFKIQLNDDDEPLDEVDTCVELQLYMDADTELELVLEADQGRPERLLELIRRGARDSTAGKWEPFERCISNYMPKYTPAGAAPATVEGQKTAGRADTLRLALKPRGPFKPDRLVGALVWPQASVALRRLYPTLSYLPDAVKLQNVHELASQWVLDADGVRKPKPALVETPPNKQRALRIDNIATGQEWFDLTSRWLSVRNVELIDEPILFVYKLDESDWVTRIELLFQRSGEPGDKWIAQTLFSAEANKSAAAPAADGQQQEQKQQPTASRQIDLPIRLKGLDSATFRLRVRHHLKPLALRSAQELAQPSDVSLTIRSLAFADACASSNKCRNGAACLPTGATTFQCACPPGYLGKFCQLVRPCEVEYGNLTGSAMCRSLGARCVDRIPVMRCEWPNDKYFQCKATFVQLPGRNSSSSSGAPLDDGAAWLDEQPETSEAGATRNPSTSTELPGDPATSEAPAGQASDSVALELLPPEEQVVRLKQVVNQQAKLIIIMGVFLAATLLFAVVLVGNMIARVRKSNKRLARSQSDNVELSRRIQSPGASAPTIFATRASGLRPGNSRGASVTAYNNSAFDVE